jgi:hypothetical protein
MPHVPGHQVISAGSIGTFDKYVVLRIGRYLNCPRGIYEVSSFSNQVEELLSKAFSQLEFWT